MSSAQHHDQPSCPFRKFQQQILQMFVGGCLHLEPKLHRNAITNFSPQPPMIESSFDFQTLRRKIWKKYAIRVHSPSYWAANIDERKSIGPWSCRTGRATASRSSANTKNKICNFPMLNNPKNKREFQNSWGRSYFPLKQLHQPWVAPLLELAPHRLGRFQSLRRPPIPICSTCHRLPFSTKSEYYFSSNFAQLDYYFS